MGPSKKLAVVSRQVLGLYLLLCSSLFSISALALPLVPADQYRGSPIITVEIILLVIGLSMTLLASLETTRIWVNLLALGFGSTIVSSVRR